MTKSRCFCASLAALALTSVVVAQPLVIDTVLVGNVGNSADPTTTFGSVANLYRIGKFEVTNAQYAEFLSEVAATDSFNLYNPSMGSDVRGGITRSGSSGSYTYAPKTGYENMPVVYVSYWDAARFANWLGTGFTEGRATQNGTILAGAAYDLNFVANPAFAAGNRLSGASVFLPSRDEWYKAAYHQPASAGGDADNYWFYATGSNTQPTSAAPAAGTDRANYFYDDNLSNGINGGLAVTQSPTLSGSQNYLTNVGAYGVNSESYYGTADQNGNVWEWNDSGSGGSRALRGGSWWIADGAATLLSTFELGFDPTTEYDTVGFRVAAIPEPGTYAAIAGALGLAGACFRRRFGRGAR